MRSTSINIHIGKYAKKLNFCIHVTFITFPRSTSMWHQAGSLGRRRWGRSMRSSERSCTRLKTRLWKGTRLSKSLTQFSSPQRYQLASQSKTHFDDTKSGKNKACTLCEAAWFKTVYYHRWLIFSVESGLLISHFYPHQILLIETSHAIKLLC